jgi:glutamyl-tRNA reductase
MNEAKVVSISPVSKPESAGRRLVLLGINHTTAPVEVRERLSVPTGRLADATRTLLHQPGIREGLILSTCNRIELLTTQEAMSEGADLTRFLEEYFSVPVDSLTPHLYEYREREAVRHLFRVASSLDSMVVGEPQILGQVKESYTVAREVGAVSSMLEGLSRRRSGARRRLDRRACPSRRWQSILPGRYLGPCKARRCCWWERERCRRWQRGT